MWNLFTENPRVGSSILPLATILLETPDQVAEVGERIQGAVNHRDYA